MKSPYTKLIAVVALASLAIMPAVSRAQDRDVSPTFVAAIDSIGEEVVKYITAQQDGTAQVAVGTFVGPSPSNSNAGVRIVLSLRECLGKTMRVADSGSYNISGEFRGEKVDGKFVTVIETAIKDGLGAQLHRLRKKVITNEEEGIAFFGPTSLDLTKDNSTTLVSTGADKTNAIIESIVNPKVHVDSTIIRPSADSPYGIEIQLKKGSDYSSMPLENDGRLAKVSLGEHDVYAIRIHNDSKKPIGVKLTIDGINVFAMSDNPSYHGKDITMALCPCSKSPIKGWYLTDSHSAEFQVAKFGETAAAKLGAFENMGTITARFFAATPKGPLNCPPCEDKKPSGEQTRSLGTKLGAKTKMNYGRLEVNFGELLGAVSARYVKSDLPTDLPSQ
ncbi:MAG: hypothetical protein WBD20_02890 [Pirellulaceae bacterium]